MAAERSLDVAEDPIADGEARHVVPVSTTTPANSLPSVGRFGLRRPAKSRMIGGDADQYPQSARFTVVPCTSTSSSPSPGVDRGAFSTTDTADGGPYSLCLAALITLRPSRQRVLR
jgi:hypothetical protein